MMLATIFGTAASAAPILPHRHTAALVAALVLVDARCGQGWHYVPAGYARHGKWRDGHCSPN
jgi:hypothetical protein